MNVVVDNLLTNYRLSGRGDLILLLHGWGDSIKGVSALQSELDKHYQVLAPDLPGFGGSEPPKDVWNLDDYAGFLSSLLEKLGLNQPYGVIGHSNGGAIAIRGLGLGKIKPKKLVLIASAGIRTNQKVKKSLLKTTAKTGKVLTYFLPETKRKSLRKKLYGVAGSDILLAPHLEETFKQTVAQDVQADAKNISCPTLLIYGEADKAIPLSDGRKFHSLIKDSRLEALPGAGHFVHQEEPAKVYTYIEEFLK
jgi:pimeloyl-ACP methyl ester carboxylesterase